MRSTRFLSEGAAALVVLIACSGAQAQRQPPLAAAAAQAQAGHFDQAAATLVAAIRGNPKAGENSYLLLSECYSQLGDPAKAEAKHYYAQWAYLNARERICVQQESEALAQPGLNDLALLQMNTLLGMCRSRLQEADGARQAFQRANEINSRQAAYDPVAAFQYGQFLTRYGDDAAAQEIVDQILQRSPRFAPAHLEKAKHYDRSGDPARAIAEARLVLSSDGNDVNSERAAHILLARCHSMLGNAGEAAKEQQWIEAHPNPETPRKPR